MPLRDVTLECTPLEPEAYGTHDPHTPHVYSPYPPAGFQNPAINSTTDHTVTGLISLVTLPYTSIPYSKLVAT